MKYFFDTEFIEDGKTIDLLSIGIVAEDGREFYLCNFDADLDRADSWVRQNVFPSLPVRNDSPQGQPTWRWVFDRSSVGSIKSKPVLREMLREFIGEDKPEFWAYYADYDWVALCQLFGRMIDLPKGWPKYCNDLKQLCVSMGDPKLPKQEGSEHHALSDARWVRDQYMRLMELK